MPRMNILNTVEREAFNSPPVFSSFQRKQYFDFPSKLRRFAADLRNPAYQLGFLLSAGYFKAARRFFSSGSFHPRDIEYVARQLEPGAPTVDFGQYHPRARQRHRQGAQAGQPRQIDSANAGQIGLTLQLQANFGRTYFKAPLCSRTWSKSSLVSNCSSCCSILFSHSVILR